MAMAQAATKEDSIQKSSFRDHYDIASKIGRGAYGDVYRFVRKDTKREYAVKLIYSDGTDLDDIQREIKICKSLDHRNVVKLVEDYVEGRYTILVFDMVWGGELFDDIADRETYSERDASHCIEQILQGVAYLHSKEIIHRDLKPENILLTNKDKDAVVKIADLGSAVETKGRDRYKYGLAGTEYYMAPEVLKHLAYGKPVDLWACGALLYIMLVGDVPCFGKDDSLAHQIETGLFAFPDARSESLCNEAKDLIKSLITLDQDERATAEDALVHPFIRQRTIVTSRFHRRDTIEDLRRFYSLTKDNKRRVSHVFSAGTLFVESFCEDIDEISDHDDVKLNAESAKANEQGGADEGRKTEQEKAYLEMTSVATPSEQASSGDIASVDSEIPPAAATPDDKAVELGSPTVGELESKPMTSSVEEMNEKVNVPPKSDET